ncbi:MAG: dTMP kinase [Propionibacteriaceae bacterium]|jgi:dTMP kinase|nr:dTMP kinase [Propionibacteriaceae bacterium]
MGVFIVFEGGDGVGKSTQAQLLGGWLEEQGREVVLTRQPGGTAFGRRVREILLDPATGEISPRAETLMYAADKAQHVVEVVRPALAEGKIVISDRYVDSMRAYQGAGRVLSERLLEELSDIATEGLEPDLTVLLDMEPQQALSGIGELDRLESAGEDFHLRVRDGFLKLAHDNAERYLVVPARLPVDEIAERVRERVSALL